MILTKLKGGLGNQMFQYACGRALSIRNDDVLKLDISGYAAQNPKDTPRAYSLSHFNIACDVAASEAELVVTANVTGPVNPFKGETVSTTSFAVPPLATVTDAVAGVSVKSATVAAVMSTVTNPFEAA